MPQPTSSDAHVNTALTNLSVAYVQEAKQFVADRAFPIVPVEQQSNYYYTFDKNDFYRDEAKPRAPGTESAGGGFRLSTTLYGCVVEAYHKDVDDQLRANADSVLSLDEAAMQFVVQKMLIRKERRWATSFFATSIWGTDATPSPLWSDVSATPGEPMRDIEVAKMAILGATGFKPNTLIMGAQVFSALRNAPRVRDQFKYTSAESINEAMLARYLDIERVLVMEGVANTSVEGNATQTTALIGGKHALLVHVPSAPSLMTPSAGYTFSWSGYTGAVTGQRISKFRMDELRSDRIEGEMAYDQKVVATSLGYFFNGAVA